MNHQRPFVLLGLDLFMAGLVAGRLTGMAPNPRIEMPTPFQEVIVSAGLPSLMAVIIAITALLILGSWQFQP